MVINNCPRCSAPDVGEKAFCPRCGLDVKATERPVRVAALSLHDTPMTLAASPFNMPRFSFSLRPLRRTLARWFSAN